MASWMIYEEWDCNLFSWKIHSVSSIPNVVGHVVQSPSFTFGGTYWTIKLYPNGDSQQNEGHMSVTVERSDEQGLVECYFYCKDISNIETDLRMTTLCNSVKKVSEPRLMRNLKECSQGSQIVIDDAFCLVLDLRKENESFNECSLPTKSGAETAGSAEGNENVVGEIIKEYEGCKYIHYVVFDIPRGLSSDYHTESPPFSFLNATWISKLRPHYRMQNSQNQNLEIVLERIESEIPVHHVEVKIRPWYLPIQQKTISFAPSQTQSPAFSFQLDEPDVSKLDFGIEITALKTTNVLLEPQNKSLEKNPASLAEPCESKVPSSETVESSTSGSNSVANYSKLLCDFKELFLKKENCDVTINVQGEEFQAHQIILQARSPVLASTFRNNMKEKKTGVIEIEDCDSSSFSDFLYFLYCGEVETLSKENVFDIFYTADKYDVQDLRAICLDFIKESLCVDTFCETISLALRHSERELLKLATDFFINNAPKIVLTVKWQSFLAENPTESNELLIKLLVPNRSNLNKQYCALQRHITKIDLN